MNGAQANSLDLGALAFWTRISARDRAFLARQLATMLSSGLALNKAVSILAGQARQPVIREVLYAVQADLEMGASFSAAAAKHPRVFDRLFVSVALSGEQVGQLAEVLSQLATQLERDVRFSNRVKSALVYPAFIVVAMIVVGVLMMVNIIPQLEQIFAETGATLPWPTRVIIATSGLLADYWWAALILALAAGGAGAVYLTSKAGERVTGFFELHLPGGLGYDVYMARFARTLGMLTRAGTPILEALSVTSEVMDNVYYRSLLATAAEQVKRGVPLSVPLGKSPLIPGIVSQMISVGEQSGRLDQILEQLLEYYEEESDRKITQLASLVEPLVIVIVGVGVAFMVYSILTPLYNIAQL